jgi:AAA+ ATPase superfamily predicted ATPase
MGKMIDIPEFVDREKEKKELKAVLSGRPNFVYFVYGPINSGKTALLMKVFEELPGDYKVFYINFRARHVAEFTDLLKVLFEVKYGSKRKKIPNIVKEFLKVGAKVVEKFKGIPIPEKVFDYLFVDSRKVEDVFKYLEDIFEEIVRRGYRPVFVLDEMQVIKEVVNGAGRSVLSELFNFAVRMTKETHLCHVLCATSDCLFVDLVYNSARLEGRAKYLLVDDLEKETAFRVYEEFGFEDKELVWGYIGGKIGDIVSLFEEKKRGYSEKDALERMLRDKVTRLESLLRALKYSPLKVSIRESVIEVKAEELKEGLKIFKEKEEVLARDVEEPVLLGGIQENILFYNPLEGTVRPQSRLLWRAIKKVMSNEGI